MYTYPTNARISAELIVLQSSVLFCDGTFLCINSLEGMTISPAMLSLLSDQVLRTKYSCVKIFRVELSFRCDEFLDIIYFVLAICFFDISTQTYHTIVVRFLSTYQAPSTMKLCLIEKLHFCSIPSCLLSQIELYTLVFCCKTFVLSHYHAPQKT